MQLKDHVRLMAEYNQWMNAKLYEVCARLSLAELHENRGAYFGSVIGTLNHLVVADILWLQRIGRGLGDRPELGDVMQLPTPEALNTTIDSNLKQLEGLRKSLDESLLSFARTIEDVDLQKTIIYKNIKGVESSRGVFTLLMHVFNHQTHHRGQMTTLLSQAGQDVGVTDLLALPTAQVL